MIVDIEKIKSDIEKLSDSDKMSLFEHITNARKLSLLNSTMEIINKIPELIKEYNEIAKRINDKEIGYIESIIFNTQDFKQELDTIEDSNHLIDEFGNINWHSSQGTC